MINLLEKEKPNHKYKVSYIIGDSLIKEFIKTDEKLEDYVRTLAILQHFVITINNQCISSAGNIRDLITDCKLFENFDTYRDGTIFIYDITDLEIVRYSDMTPVEVELNMDDLMAKKFKQIRSKIKHYIKDLNDYDELTYEGFVECHKIIKSTEIENF